MAVETYSLLSVSCGQVFLIGNARLAFIAGTFAVGHHIPTGDAKPIKCHPYNRSPHEKEIISRHVKVMLEEGAIKRVKSPWQKEK